MQAYGNTEIGQVRTSNQDAFMCGNLSPNTLYAVVCDGMGGVNGGNIASAMAVELISARIREQYKENMNSNFVRHLLESAISAANVDIYDAAMADVKLRGMGTTVVAVLVIDHCLYVAHVGDSRLYCFCEGALKQLTRDHSIVQAMVEKGQLTPMEAKNHPRKHFITRALGVDDTVLCDYAEFSLSPGDILLLCTDGLTNMVETDDIYTILQSAGAEQAVNRLIDAANMAGGNDNITVVTIA